MLLEIERLQRILTGDYVKEVDRFIRITPFQVRQLRPFRLASPSPTRPETEEHHGTPVALQRNGLAERVMQGELGCRPSCSRGAVRGRGWQRAGPEQNRKPGKSGPEGGLFETHRDPSVQARPRPVNRSGIALSRGHPREVRFPSAGSRLAAARAPCPQMRVDEVLQLGLDLLTEPWSKTLRSGGRVVVC
jgi:hypothetical protein